MDDSGTKVLPKKLPPLSSNRIIPMDPEIDFKPSEGGFKIEATDVKKIEDTQRSELAPPIQETLPPNQPSSEQIIEGQVSKWSEQSAIGVPGFFIVLHQQQLSVYEGYDSDGKLLNQYPFPHGAEYRFHRPDLCIYDKNGQETKLFLGDSLFNALQMEWCRTNTNLFTDFVRKPAEEKTGDDFQEINYSLKFNLPSFREFVNVYNDEYMTLFQNYRIVEGKPEIKNAVEFKHSYRPNRMMKSYEQKYDRQIENHMTNRDRKFIQWAPSRDWSRLFVLSKTEDQTRGVFHIFMEFYDFRNQKQSNLSSPLRINFLSQLLRPKQIRHRYGWVKSQASSVKIEASFSGDCIVINKNQIDISIKYINPNWTYKSHLVIRIFDAQSENEGIKLSCSKLYVKFNGFYYEQLVSYFSENYVFDGYFIEVRLDKDFIKTNLKNIIQCGIYDILVYEKYVKILNNINPLNELEEIEVDDDTLQLLKSQSFIQLDHHTIACLPQPFNDGQIRIKIIEISQENLVQRKTYYDSNKILLQSPWNTQASDCQFSFIKFKDYKYAVFIVSSPSKKEQFYQYYERNEAYDYILLFQKPVSDYINLQQIPHLPFVTINGTQFINCDSYINNHQTELDLQFNQQEILIQDQENINSQKVVVYNENFIKSLLRFIEEKEDIIGTQAQCDWDFSSIDIPELRTSIIINSGEQNRGVLIFQHSLDKIKQLKIKQPIRYKTHKVIYRDTSYDVSIILSVDDALYEMRLCFDLTGVTLTPFRLIMELTDAQKIYDIYLHDDFKVSLFISGSDCCFKHFSQNQQGQQEETIKIDFIDEMSWITIPLLSQFIQRIAHSQSISFGKLFLQNFKAIIFKNAEGLIKEQEKTRIIAFQNKMIIFENGVNRLTIMDDSFNVIGTVILRQFPPSIIRIDSSMDPRALECIDEFNNIFPFPILGNLQDYKSFNELLNNYKKNIGCPMPIQFGLLDGFISCLDLQSKKLSFFKSIQDMKDGNISARIEIIAERESFIDKIINSKERKEIEELLNSQNMNHLLSYNLNKRMNLITATRNHEGKEHIYSVLYKLLEIAEIKELPMLIYNTSVVPTQYESILDVLIDNKAIKLAQLIVSIAIKQDQIGYIYSRLYHYLEIFSADELQIFFENQIFFFKIPEDCYQEYQIVKNTLIRPFSDNKTFSEIKNNMNKVESQFKQIDKHTARTGKKDPDHPEQEKERGQLQISEKNMEQIEDTVPIEYFAINLMSLIQSRNKSFNENHREVTRMINKFVEKDQTVIEKESLQIIIDFKWDSYAWKFFSVQLGLFICFTIAFIYDIVAVSKNSHVFSSDDSNQVIPRIVSIAILIPFAIYEIANIVVATKTYLQSLWNFNDILLIALYVTYFTITFARPEQKDVLKIFQLLIVIFSFIKFSYLIRIWTKVSFLVRMLIVVFKELIIFLLFFLLMIGGLTVMAFIIMNESGDSYDGIKSAAFFVIVLRQSIGDYDTSSIIDGSQEFQILAWFLWLLILIIGNVVFMNFIIAVVSESYESCMERKIQLIYRAKLEMIQECEELLPIQFFNNKNWFPRFIIIRREQGSSAGGDNSDEWYGFVKQIQRHLEHENFKLKEMLNRSTDSTKKEMKTGHEEVKKVTADVAEVKKDVAEVKKDVGEVKKDVAEVKKDGAEMKKDVAEVKVQMNQINLILSAVFKDKIAEMKALNVQANDNQAI